MGQLETVVRWTKKLEAELESRLGAEGRGLHEKASSVEHLLDGQLLRKLRRIATIRNRTMHEDGYVIEDVDVFVNDCAGAFESLSAMDAVVSEIPTPSTPAVEAPNLQKKRVVSVWFAWTLFLFPHLAAWFTLRPGYSFLARFLAFAWMAMVTSAVFLPQLLARSGGAPVSPSIFPLLLLAVAWYLWRVYPAKINHANWKSWPTLEEYWQINPKTKTENGTKCYCCGARTIRSFGWDDGSDSRRISRCGQCEAVLFRTAR